MATTITLTNDDQSTFTAYVATPEGTPKGAVLVIHEIWGLVDHITGIADRLAAEGYLAVAPDLLTHIGIEAHIGLELQNIMFSPDDAVRTEGQPRLREALAPLSSPEFAKWAIASLTSVVDWATVQPEIDGRVAVTGFCFGGTYSFALAAADARIVAAVPFYGTGPDPQKLAGISCPVLAFYGETDEALMTALPTLTEQFDAAGIDFTPVVYPDTGHAFFNDTNVITYHADVAADAWSRALGFLDRELTAG